jgi:hypothetical protein
MLPTERVAVRRFICLAAGLGIAATAVAGIGYATAGSTDQTAAGSADTTTAQPAVVLGHGDDRLPSATAADWVTYADYVVVVSATSERALPPARTETERGEGVIGRKVGLEVKKVLWSRKGAAQPAPRSWEYNASGWVFSDGKPEDPAPFALEDRPRIESGHQYVLAITWEAPRCSPGDAPEPARWMGLGGGSELPFDGAVIGQGENEGQAQTVTEARTEAAAAGSVAELKDELAGQGASGLVARLTAATPGERPVPLQSATTCG